MIATGQHIDPDKSRRFGEQLDAVYQNPFVQPKREMSAGEIKEHLLERIRETRRALEKAEE